MRRFGLRQTALAFGVLYAATVYSAAIGNSNIVTGRVFVAAYTVGLGGRVDHLPDELSGAERQRCAIARALSVYPPVLLADEPTGNLDTHTGAEILKLIRDVHQRLGATVLIVTHDSQVAESCGRVIMLRDGRVVEDRAGCGAGC